MTYLEAFGIKPGSDERHLIMVDDLLQAEDFFQKAEGALAQLAPVVLEEVVPHLEEYHGRWNPGGFMAFPLGLHDELGSLRLHIWPVGVPRENSDGPNIHNHAWFLSSRILAGVYSDTLFELEEHDVMTDSEYIRSEGLLQVFETRRNPDGLDELVTDGLFVRPIPILNREVSAGGTHRIYLDMYHVTTVPIEQLAMTLIFDSPAFATTTRVLIDSARIKSGRSRKVIESSNALLAKDQIMQALR